MKRETILILDKAGNKHEIEVDMPDHGPDPLWKMINGKLYGWANRNHHSPAFYAEAPIGCYDRAKAYFNANNI